MRGDFFLDTKDTHQVFYFTFGWLALWLSPPALAWVGRVLTWALLAWSWRRLSFAVVPRPWWSVLTAALFVCLLERFHMAGEWVIGGVEAKGFAFVLVFLAIEALVRGRFRSAWLLLGAASALHVLVGGWSVVALGNCLVALWQAAAHAAVDVAGRSGRFRAVAAGADPRGHAQLGDRRREVVRFANQVYVYGRLAHHLAPGQLPPVFVVRFVALFVVWLILCWAAPREAALRRLHAFVAGAVILALIGAAIAPLNYVDPALAAGLLRFYWFRLADVAVPLGVALTAALLVAETLRTRPAIGRWALAGMLAIAGIHVGGYLAIRPIPTIPPADRLPNSLAWETACDWIAHTDAIPPQAKFLTPRMSQTFKWYTGHAEVANWKEVPQDATAIVEWWRRVFEIHRSGSDDPQAFWLDSLAELGAPRLKQLGAKYGADYALTLARPALPLEVVYRNRSYVVYRLCDPRGKRPGTHCAT